MELCNLDIEKISATEEEKYHAPSDYEYKKRKTEGIKPNTLYSRERPNKYTSGKWWLGKDRVGVSVVLKPNDNGSLRVWEFPDEKDRFVIGTIAAIDSESKISVAQVLNNKTFAQSAELVVKMAPDLFAYEVIKLSILYNLARIGFERSDHRHGLSLQHALLSGNQDKNIIAGYGYRLLHIERTFDKVKDRYTDNYGFELTEGIKIRFYDSLTAVLREKNIELKSEDLVKELQIPTLIQEGYKSDWGNRAYAMFICYEMARLYPYREPVKDEEEPPRSRDNI